MNQRENDCAFIPFKNNYTCKNTLDSNAKPADGPLGESFMENTSLGWTIDSWGKGGRCGHSLLLYAFSFLSPIGY